MTNNKLKEEILKKQAGGVNSFTATDGKGNFYIRSDKVMEAMESYHRQRVEGITDEMIENRIAELGEGFGVSDKMIKGAKWFRDRLLIHD